MGPYVSERQCGARLGSRQLPPGEAFGSEFESVLKARLREADENMAINVAMNLVDLVKGYLTPDVIQKAAAIRRRACGRSAR